MTTKNKFGTFEGVFTPTILTIIGVILYLRLGWVVGEVGLYGTILIIFLAHVATITTSLSLSSMTTNIKIGAGGFYSILAKSLGLEVAGAIGIPLYLSQTLGSALYIIGFTELWTNIFAHHNFTLVALILLFALIIISYIGAKLAMKIQYLIMVVLFLSIVSFSFKFSWPNEVNLIWRQNPDVSFWAVFAVFFPAVTGIGSGAAMSGDLANPRRSLPLGILSAVAVGLIVYLGVAIWYAGIAEPHELKNNYFIIRDKAILPIVVTLGIMGATLSSALGTLVGAPRILMAMAKDRAVPFSALFASHSKNGEPRVALILTSVIILAAILMGSLDVIATLLTMFFLITYGMINLAVFIEKAIGIPSFRPSFNIPLIVPILGSLWCFAIMFLINAAFAGLAIITIIVFYAILVRQEFHTPGGDVRHGFLTSIAELASRAASKVPDKGISWKPNLLVPIEEPADWQHLMDFIKAVVFPSGTLRLFSVSIEKKSLRERIKLATEKLRSFGNAKNGIEVNTEMKLEHSKELEFLNEAMKEICLNSTNQGIFTSHSVIEANDFIEGVSIVTQTLKGMFFPPNTMFLTMSSDKSKDKRLQEMMAIAVRAKLGIIIMDKKEKAVAKTYSVINIWLRSSSPNRHLALLIGLQLARNWSSSIRLLAVVDKADDIRKNNNILAKIIENGRLPRDTGYKVILGSYREVLQDAPQADLNIFGMGMSVDTDYIHKTGDVIDSPCLFLRDSGQESLFA